MRNRIEREQRTVRRMIRIYSRHKLHEKEMSETYVDLADYACKRLSNCLWGEDKPACKDCNRHCYAPQQRARIREVMRWVGPRMIFYSPKLAWQHVLLRLFC